MILFFYLSLAFLCIAGLDGYGATALTECRHPGIFAKQKYPESPTSLLKT